MKTRIGAIALAFLGLASACKTEVVQGPPADHCESDADCELLDLLTKGEDRCCPACGYSAANKDWVQKFEASCRSAEPEDCGMYKCDPPVNPRAVCENRTCTVKTD